MKQKRKYVLSVFVLLTALLVLTLPVQAASKKYRNTWRTLNGKNYYMDANGNRVTGLKKIKNKYYYFNSKGVQQTGWRCVNQKYYYYFYKRSGKKGYAAKNRVINGIKINDRYHASLGGKNLRKLKLMVEANNVVDRITTPSMTTRQKLWACFTYTKKTYSYYNWRNFSYYKGWELDFAEDMLFKGRGTCEAYAAAFAFLANAVGMKDVNVICSGGHGWAEIHGKIYDPDWALVSSVDTYFDMSYDLSGYNGRPSYKNNRVYVAPI